MRRPAARRSPRKKQINNLMKTFYLLTLLLLSACATTPRLTLRPQPIPPADNLRNPEVIHAYHFGRYTDPNDDLILNEQHELYRVEQTACWNLTPGCSATYPETMKEVSVMLPLANDAIVAEVNAQKIATAQILGQARRLAGALTRVQMNLLEAKTNWQQEAGMRAVLSDVTHRLATLEAAQGRATSSPPIPTELSTNHESFDPLTP